MNKAPTQMQAMLYTTPSHQQEPQEPVVLKSATTKLSTNTEKEPMTAPAVDEVADTKPFNNTTWH